MIRNVFAATAVAVMAGTAFAAHSADFCFPSANPPGGKKAADVKQYVSFIWDDNGYSGEAGTMYEYSTKEVKYEDRGIVGGTGSGSGQNNPLNIQEGGMGLSWAVSKLGPKTKNGHMTFNMISGLYVPTWGPEWYDRQSEYGSYENGKTDEGQDWTVAASNGREQEIRKSKGGEIVEKAYMVQGVKKMIKAGHELGNHTIDHIETNSPYPQKVFDKFGYGEAFDDGSSKKDALGNPFDEADAYGTEGAALTMGWMDKAGYALSQKGWEGVITAGEEPSKNYVEKSKPMYSFRAPRLEVNSNLFLALKAKNYLYDCGLEEGYEEDVDGTNFLWPYTTDNGSVNTWTQKTNGENMKIDAMPMGLWQYPVNVMIVPENIRGEVWENFNKIAVACGEKDIEKKEEFAKHGKVTGFDFNMFILYGMTGANVVKTLNNSLDLRMQNNKAPMQIGCHTDYFTPMYDYATLQSDFNKDKYGLVISEKWNNWIDRKQAWEKFADDAVKKGAIFASGKEVIEAIKAYRADEIKNTGEGYAYKTTWSFFDNESKPATPGSEEVEGDFNNMTVKIPSGTSNYPTFASDSAKAGSYKGLTHISLDYKTNTALSLQLVVEGDDYTWNALLNNLNTDVKSGIIPVSAFRYSGGATAGKTLDVSKVTGIAINVLTTGGKEETNAVFTAKNFKTYGVDLATPISGLVSAKSEFVKMKGVNANTLNLNVSTAGIYTVQVFTSNGRLVRSINNQSLVQGSNGIKLDALPAGVYMMKISTQNKSQVLKAVVM